MSKLEIYLKDELILSIFVEDYDINTYANGLEVECTVQDIKITYSIPLNKGYKLVAEV